MNRVNKINERKDKIESIFSYFNRIFYNIDAKTNLKSNKIYVICEKNKDEIIQTLNETKTNIIFETIKDNLNACRYALIQKLKSKMAQDINQVNEIIKEYKTDKLKKLNSDHIEKIKVNIKHNLLYFNQNKSKLLIYKDKFIQPYDLHRLDKYSSLTKIKRVINIDSNESDELVLLKTINHDNEYLLALSPDKILVRTGIKSISIIDNRTGVKICSGKLTYDLEFDKHQLKSTFSYLVYFHKFNNDLNISNKIEIFDFQLNLVNKFELDQRFEYDMTLNNNEIAFKTTCDSSLCIYNCEASKLNFINLQQTNETQPFYVHDTNDELLHIDKEKFYFLKYRDYVYLINRFNGHRLVNIYIYDVMESRVNYVNKKKIFFDKNIYIYFFDGSEKMLKIFDSKTGEMVFKSIYNEDYLELCLTEYGTVVFKQYYTGKTLIYFEL